MANGLEPAPARWVAGGLLTLVAGLVSLQFGGLIATALAVGTGGNHPSQLIVPPDPTSDAVSAIAAEFRVDESGAATYAVPLYGVPGTAGVAPKLSLNYSSQGDYGPLGKGWSIGGLSSISRCRATRESGDFLSAATADGDPAPINFTSSDRYCLDGQRLVPSSASCPSAGGISGLSLATEIDSFQRVCAYDAGDGRGPKFFTVERKDGSTSWYGDRDHSGGANRPDGYFAITSPLNSEAAFSWAQTRFQDSTGNYVDYRYLENPAGAGTGEHLLSEVHYTGKIALPGQTAGASVPYARIVFHYAARPTGAWGKGFASGGVLTQSRQLQSITACASMACTTQEQARHYLLTYQASASGSGLDTLVGLQECNNGAATVCSEPTVFEWSQARFEFATVERPIDSAFGGAGNFDGFKLGDVDGDGRQDMVWLRDAVCATEQVMVSFSHLDASGIQTFVPAGTPVCTPTELIAPVNQANDGRTLGDASWQLFDYNGDGLDDLFVAGGGPGDTWAIHPSRGRASGPVFDTSVNLIAGIAIPVHRNATQIRKAHPQLADINGDGLLDVVYRNNGIYYARMMEPVVGGYAWGGQRSVSFPAYPAGNPCSGLGSSCTSGRYIELSQNIGAFQLHDFNGDARSDLTVQVVNTWTYRTEEPCEPTGPGGPLGAGADGAGSAELVSATPDAVGCTYSTQGGAVAALVVQSLTATQVAYAPYGYWGSRPPSLIFQTQEVDEHFADFNGDGTTDLLREIPGAASQPYTAWDLYPNTGTGFAARNVVPNIPNQNGEEKQVQIADANGDGRADLLYWINAGSRKKFVGRLGLSAGGLAPETLLPGDNASVCEGSGCLAFQKATVFGDFDGDAALDFLSLRTETNVDLYLSRASARHVPRDAIVRITNGLGSQTDLAYAPLTNQAVYRRASGTRNLVNWGRGAPVLDLLSPAYVVARAASSSPQPGNPAAKAAVHYRYANARVQAGGRGLLGFETIDTIDPNQSGGVVVTTTRYAQNFPFVGLPVRTLKKAIPNGAYAVPACLAGNVDNACFATPGTAHPDLGGSWFSDSTQAWEVAGSLAAPGPLHVRTQGTEESLRDPFTGTLTSKVLTAFGYGSHGNVVQTVADTYTGGASAPMATVITSNQYNDEPATWRLGRLSGSSITHRRPGTADVVRTTGFSYALGGANTGLLTEERVQPGGSADQALATRYALDDYGNRVQTTACAAPSSDCDANGLDFQPASATRIKRTSRVAYDAQGRYPVATYAPFWNGAGGEERVTGRVLARNLFGAAVHTADANHVQSLAVAGALGRDYYTWTQTTPGATPGNGGAASLTTYRKCSQVACPAGASFRQQVVAQGAPRQWAWFDVLGRPVLKASETFNVGVSGQDVSAVCTDYDLAGKPKRVSTPFFLPGVAEAEGPANLANICLAAERKWTVTTYDVLGRPTQVASPDGSQVASSHTGLSTTVADQRGHPTTRQHNGKGELVAVIDAAGLATHYDYDAAGNLTALRRDAGAGVIVNSFSYDALGRKVAQTDPDTGTTRFEINALGELTAEIDVEGNRIEQARDARGRVWRRTVRKADGTVETEAHFVFDTAPNGTGQLAQESIAGTYGAWAGQAGMALDYFRTFSYDSLGRPQTAQVQTEGQIFGTFAAYDALGRPWKTQDASALWSKTQYGARGHAAALCASHASDADPACAGGADTWQRTLATDAWGQATKERRGDSAAMEVVREYWADTGRVARICAGNGSCQLTDERYGWDAAGNLSSHVKESRYLEQFAYDSLDRLTESRLLTRNGQAVNELTLSHGYDALGNVCSKNGVAYAYGIGSGCSGASGLAATAHASSAEAWLPAYQRSRVDRSAGLLRNEGGMRAMRGVQFAPESRYRRYSEDDDDAPSWEHEDDAWGLNEGAASPSFWVAKPKARPARAPLEFSKHGARLSAVAAAAQQPGPDGNPMLPPPRRPHAVMQTGSGASATVYAYGLHGNQILRDAPGTADDRTIRYSLDDKPHEILMGAGATERFWYGPDGQRYKRSRDGATKLYIGNVEVVLQGGVATFKRYIGGIALQVVTGGAVQSTRFLFHDHLGSLVRVTHADGSVAEALDYAAFGDRRSATDPHAGGAPSTVTPRGYTSHEMLDGTGVVHMNGRIYDAGLGRFLQADPVIQAPGDAQSWNAYSYVFNNPLRYTDPTGMMADGLRMFLGVAIAMVGSMVCQGMDGGFWMKLGMAIAFGAASGYAATGTTQGAVQGAFTAGVAFGIGWAANTYGWGDMTRIGAQALSGGIMESLQGGNFGNGFVAAGMTSTFTAGLGNVGNTAVRTAMGAIIGGSLSEATGGKFANGAISGAMQMAMVSSDVEAIGASSDMPADKIQTSKVSGTLERSSLNAENGYEGVDEAAIAQYNAYSAEYAAAGKSKEVLGLVFEQSGRQYFSTVMTVPKQFTAAISLKGIRAKSLSGYTHTHPDGSGFSGLDYKTPSTTRLPYFVRNSQGQVYRWEAAGALKYARYVDGLQGAGSARSQATDLSDPGRWGITSVCGDQPCVR